MGNDGDIAISAQDSFGYGFSMMKILAAAPPGTTHQMSPIGSPDPIGHGVSGTRSLAQS